MRFIFLCTLISLMSTSAFAEVSFVKDKDYILLANPVSTQDPSKIEVVEVFSYHCSHCLDFEPLLESWVKKQTSDIQFLRVHAAWQPFMKPLQRGFYTASKLNLQSQVQMAAFTEFQLKRNKLETAEAWANLLETYGAKREDVLSRYESFGVSAEINKANAKIRAYKITGTPTLIIDGRYRIDSPAGKNSHQKMLAIADYLINKTRNERNLKK